MGTTLMNVLKIQQSSNAVDKKLICEGNHSADQVEIKGTTTLKDLNTKTKWQWSQNNHKNINSKTYDGNII